MFTSIYTLCDEKAFSDLLGAARVIEEDGYGLKVLLLENGNYFKLFRIKHLVSSARIYNPAKRFRDNAKKLLSLGIPTVEVTQLYSIPHIQRWAAQYSPLSGETLSSIIESNNFDETKLASLVNFIHELHEKGVYFRALHAGNIILGTNNKWGLIDVLDCRFNKELAKGKRQRNLQHLFRYDNIKPFRKKIDQLYWGKTL